MIMLGLILYVLAAFSMGILAVKGDLLSFAKSSSNGASPFSAFTAKSLASISMSLSTSGLMISI